MVTYGAVRLLKMFPTKSWTLSGLKTLIGKIDSRRSIERCPGSGRPRTARVAANIADLEDLVLSQVSTPTHKRTAVSVRLLIK